MREIIPEPPIQIDYEMADYAIQSTIFREAIKQTAHQQKQAQTAKPAPHPSGLNRKQRRARRHHG